MAPIVIDLQPKGLDEFADRRWLYELSLAMQALEPEVAVRLQSFIDDDFVADAEEVVERLPELDDSELRRVIAEFRRRWPDPSPRARRRFFAQELERRHALLATMPADERIALLRRSARDFADRSGRWRAERAREDPYGLVAGNLSLNGFYERLWERAEQLDPEAAALAPTPPSSAGMLGPGEVVYGEVLSVVLPAAAGAATAKLVDLAVDWMRRRRSPLGRRRFVKIYGPDGEVLHEVHVEDESDEAT